MPLLYHRERRRRRRLTPRVSVLRVQVPALVPVQVPVLVPLLPRCRTPPAARPLAAAVMVARRRRCHDRPVAVTARHRRHMWQVRCSPNRPSPALVKPQPRGRRLRPEVTTVRWTWAGTSWRDSCPGPPHNLRQHPQRTLATRMACVSRRGAAVRRSHVALSPCVMTALQFLCGRASLPPPLSVQMRVSSLVAAATMRVYVCLCLCVYVCVYVRVCVRV
jgi:hypothetical protein